MRPVVLCILDGWGLNPSRDGNAVAQAATPNFDRIWTTCPHAQLAAHGHDVGLPDGQMGNSEVGHTNIGAGRIVWMDLPRIDNAIADGSFAANPALAELHRRPEGQRRHRAPRGPRLARWRPRPPAPDRRRRHRHRRRGHSRRRPRLPRRPRRAAAERARPDRRARGRAARRRPHRHRLRPLLRHGPRQALGAGRGGRGGDPARRRRARPDRGRGDRGRLRPRRDRRVRHRRPPSAPTTAPPTATASSSPTSAPTAPGKSSAPWSTRTSAASRWSAGRTGRRCSAWCNTPPPSTR